MGLSVPPPINLALSNLIHGFPYVDTWISLCCFMDLSKLLHGFVNNIKWICQSCSLYFSPFAKLKQAEVWPRFHILLKLLLWTKVVKWIKVLNALGPLCRWQCFVIYSPNGVSGKLPLTMVRDVDVDENGLSSRIESQYWRQSGPSAVLTMMKTLI